MDLKIFSIKHFTDHSRNQCVKSVPLRIHSGTILISVSNFLTENKNQKYFRLCVVQYEILLVTVAKCQFGTNNF